VATQPAMVLKPGLVGTMRRSQESYLKVTVPQLPGSVTLVKTPLRTLARLKGFEIKKVVGAVDRSI
jgi:hypothetical protein